MVQGNTDHWKVQEYRSLSGVKSRTLTAHLALVSSSAEHSPLPSVVMGPDEITDIEGLHREMLGS